MIDRSRWREELLPLFRNQPDLTDGFRTRQRAVRPRAGSSSPGAGATFGAFRK